MKYNFFFYPIKAYGTSFNHEINCWGEYEFPWAISAGNVHFTTVLKAKARLTNSSNKPCGPDIFLVLFVMINETSFVQVTLIYFLEAATELQYIEYRVGKKSDGCLQKYFNLQKKI